MKSMASMKTLLRLLGAGVLTTVATTSVVACGDKSNPGTAMDAKVSQNLSLTDVSGKGLIKASIDITDPKKPVWKTDLTVTNLAAKLLETGADPKLKGKDTDSTAFLKDVLKLTADADGKFTVADVNAIVATVSNLKPTIGANTAKTDYVVTGGTYTLQFSKADKTKLGDEYTINLAIDALTGGIVNTAIPTLTIADFDVANSEISDFKITSTPTKVENLVGKTTKLVTTSPSDVNTQIVEVMKLLGNKTATYTVSAQSKTTGTWATGDHLTLKITTPEVTAGFATTATLTLA